MFTICPKCALTLAVTAGDLRIGQGYVRCGRCASVFNALVALSDETSPEAQATSPPAPAPDPEQTWDPEALPEDSLEFTLGSTEVSRIFVQAEPDDPEVGTGTFEQIILESADRPDEEQPAPEDGAPPTADGSDIDAPLDVPGETTAPEIVAVPAATVSPAPALPEALFPERPRRWPLITGIVALGLVLLLQWLHHSRNDLALQPALRAPLATLYGALGVPLTPNWDLHAYDVRQLGAAEAPGAPGSLLVRASVRNAARRPQPMPLLRLTLRDRYGALLAGRDLSPHDYLGSSAGSGRLLGAGQRIDANIVLVDPGNEAVGFEIDACLPAPRGVRCATDQPASP